MYRIVSQSILFVLLVCCAEGFRFPTFGKKNSRFQVPSSLSRLSQYNLKFNPENVLDKLSAVQNMKIDDELKSMSPFLLRGEPVFAKQEPKLFGMFNSAKPVSGKLGAFHWESCGPADQTINIRNLTLGPSPLYLPGNLKVGFDVEFRKSISESNKLQGKLQLQLQTGGSWLNIPCIGNIGSCSYSDLCSLSQLIPACPPEFVAANIPCKCPFNKGEYKLPEMSVEIDASIFLPGTYRAQVTLSDLTDGQLGCYKLSFTIG